MASKNNESDDYYDDDDLDDEAVEEESSSDTEPSDNDDEAARQKSSKDAKAKKNSSDKRSNKTGVAARREFRNRKALARTFSNALSFKHYWQKNKKASKDTSKLSAPQTPRYLIVKAGNDHYQTECSQVWAFRGDDRNMPANTISLEKIQQRPCRALAAFSSEKDYRESDGLAEWPGHEDMLAATDRERELIKQAEKDELHDEASHRSDFVHQICERERAAMDAFYQCYAQLPLAAWTARPQKTLAKLIRIAAGANEASSPHMLTLLSVQGKKRR